MAFDIMLHYAHSWEGFLLCIKRSLGARREERWGSELGLGPPALQGVAQSYKGGLGAVYLFLDVGVSAN